MDENFEVQNILLNMRHLSGPHTGAALHAFFIETLSEWGIDAQNRHLIWVTDNAKNMINSVIQEENWERIPCFAHTLQLAVTDCK